MCFTKAAEPVRNLKHLTWLYLSEENWKCWLYSWFHGMFRLYSGTFYATLLLLWCSAFFHDIIYMEKVLLSIFMARSLHKHWCYHNKTTLYCFLNKFSVVINFLIVLIPSAHSSPPPQNKVKNSCMFWLNFKFIISGMKLFLIKWSTKYNPQSPFRSRLVSAINGISKDFSLFRL